MRYISAFLQFDVTTTYITYAIHCKYSVSDEVYKRYKHTLYKLSLDDVPDYMSGDNFVLDGKTCSWKSVEELENDTNTMEKNDDIIAFVKTKCK